MSLRGNYTPNQKFLWWLEMQFPLNATHPDSSNQLRRSHNTVPLWLMHCIVAPDGIAAAYPHSIATAVLRYETSLPVRGVWMCMLYVYMLVVYWDAYMYTTECTVTLTCMLYRTSPVLFNALIIKTYRLYCYFLCHHLWSVTAKGNFWPILHVTEMI